MTGPAQTPAGTLSRAMILAIARKEVRQLLPLVVALLLITAMVETGEWLLDPPDVTDRASSSWLLSATPGIGWVFAVLGLVTAYNLVASEREQGTFTFLFALPIRRRTLFLLKYAVGVVVLILAQLLSAIPDLLQELLNGDSIARRQLDPFWMAVEIVGLCAFTSIAVAYGLLLAYFGRWGWLLLLMYGLLTNLGKTAVPALGIVTFEAPFAVEHFGSRPLIPWSAWAVHGAMAAGALLVATRLWSGTGTERETRAVGPRPGSRIGRVVVWGGLGLAILVSGLLGVFQVVDSGTEERTEDEAGAQAQTRRTLATEHFHFTYHVADEPKALALARQADSVYQAVRDFLGANDIPTIIADLTDVSPEHEGIAGRQRLRMDLSAERPGSHYNYVLHHEVTHVFSEAIVGEVGDRRMTNLRFFSEGLAEFASFELLALTDIRQDGRLQAARARRQFGIGLGELAAPAAFLERHDEYLFYCMGEAWVAALVEVCGKGAPTGVLRAASERDLPQEIGGIPLLRELLARQRCSYDHVQTVFEKRLGEDASAAARLPYATARVLGGEADGQVAFEVAVEAPSPGQWPVLLIIRDGPDSQTLEQRFGTATVEVGKPQRVRVSLDRVQGHRFQFRVGVRPRPDARPFFTRWRFTSVPDGAAGEPLRK